MKEKMRALIVRHCETLKQEAAEIAAAMDGADPQLSGRRAGLVARAHKLKGSSGSIGFTEISDLSRDIEILLRGAGDRPLTAAEQELIAERHTELQTRIAGIAPAQSALYARLA